MSAYRSCSPRPAPAPRSTAPVPWPASYEAEDAAITGGPGLHPGHRLQRQRLRRLRHQGRRLAQPGRQQGRLHRGRARGPARTTWRSSTATRPARPPRQQLIGRRRRRRPRSPTPPPRTGPTAAKKDRHRPSSPPGGHALTLAKGTAEVTLDRIDLTADHRSPSAAYEATLADTTGSPSYDYSSSAGTGTGALVLRLRRQARSSTSTPRATATTR